MPAVDVDVGTIPDIIEAQLTLSYSRLTNLIRVIVEQGNGHDDDITDLRERLNKLQRDNSQLREEVEELRKGKEERARLAAQVQELAGAVELQRKAADARHSKAADAAAAHDAALAAARAEMTGMQESVAKVQAALQAQSAQLHELASGTELCRAFTSLWAAQPDQLREMASREVQDETHTVPGVGGGDFEYSVEERTKYLHSLPAFTRLYDELDIVRSMMQKQAADALTAKMTAVEQVAKSQPSQPLSARSSNLTQHNADHRASLSGGLAAQQTAQQQEAMQAAVQALEQRMKALELGQQQQQQRRRSADVLVVDDEANGGTAAAEGGDRATVPTAEARAAMPGYAAAAVEQLGERMDQLEERLRALIRLQADGGEQPRPDRPASATKAAAAAGESAGAARAPVGQGGGVSAAWADLDCRVQRIEHVLDGLPHSHRNSGSHTAYEERGGGAPHDAATRQDRASSALAASAVNPPAPHSRPSSRNGRAQDHASSTHSANNEASQHSSNAAATAGGETATSVTAAPAATLPPLARKSSASASNHTLAPAAPANEKSGAGNDTKETPFASSPHAQGNGNSSYGGAVHELVQPNVAVLRRRESQLNEQPQAPPQTAQAQYPRGATPRVSVVVEPEDGLRRRVTQVEENVAILELNKVDRQELRVMEAALRDAMQRLAMAGSAMPHIPHRPSSAGPNGVASANGNAFGGGGGGGGGRNYVDASGARLERDGGGSSVGANMTGSAPLAMSRDSNAGRPQSYGGMVGRPVYVSGSSISLRDGYRLTNASISPSVMQ